MSDSSQGRRCSLVLPGLLNLPAAEMESAFAQVGRLPQLEWFFSRAQVEDFSGSNFPAVMFSLFDADVSVDKDLPVATVSYAGETGEINDDWCVRADPVQLIPDRDQLVLMGPESLSLTQTEADGLVAELNAQFAEDGWRIEACTPTRWYLHQADEPGLRTYDLAQVRGHAIGDYLPKGLDGKQWHRLMNEVQMVLHTCAVNQQRIAAGQTPVSSLWFWGGGKAPEIKQGRWHSLCGDEPLSQGLAMLSNTLNNTLPENAKAWLNTVVDGENLLVMHALADHLQNGEMENWLEQVKAIEHEWIAPLIMALRSGQICELSIYGCNGRLFSLSRSGLKRWWRRKKPLAVVAAT